MAFGVLELGVTLVRLSDRNLGRPPFQTPVVMTQGGGCVSEQESLNNNNTLESTTPSKLVNFSVIVKSPPSLVCR